MILSRTQLLPQRFQPALKAMGCRSVRTSRYQPPTPLHSRDNGDIGFKQDVLATDLVPKGVEAEGWSRRP